MILAMAAAVFFSERNLFVNQAAISAILVIVLQPLDSGFSTDRFFNALAGGVVALAVNHLFPINPEHLIERTARPIFDELSAVLEEVTGNESLVAGHETARLSPTTAGSWNT
jgi:uncharacterized membrane protein YgaE (UPF0421/DUF939 family)